MRAQECQHNTLKRTCENWTAAKQGVAAGPHARMLDGFVEFVQVRHGGSLGPHESAVSPLTRGGALKSNVAQLGLPAPEGSRHRASQNIRTFASCEATFFRPV